MISNCWINSGRLTSTRGVLIAVKLTRSPYLRARRCSVPSGSLRISSAIPKMGRPFGPGGTRFPLVVIVLRLQARGLLHPRVIGHVEPAEHAMNDHPQYRMVRAPRQCDGQHAAEAPHADACRTSASAIAHRGSPFGWKPAQP